MTAARDPAVVRQSLSMGVVQYLLKPFTAAALEERLRAYARFRADVAAASGDHGIDQQAIDEALSSCGRPPAGPRRGGARPAGGRRGACGSACGTRTLGGGGGGRDGAVRVSARRYLEHLTTAGRARREPRYGGSGRPELAYHPTPAL